MSKDKLDEILGELYRHTINPFLARREIEKLYQQARVTPPKEIHGGAQKLASIKTEPRPTLLGRKHVTGR